MRKVLLRRTTEQSKPGYRPKNKPVPRQRLQLRQSEGRLRRKKRWRNRNREKLKRQLPGRPLRSRQKLRLKQQQQLKSSKGRRRRKSHLLRLVSRLSKINSKNLTRKWHHHKRKSPVWVVVSRLTSTTLMQANTEL